MRVMRCIRSYVKKVFRPFIEASRSLLYGKLLIKVSLTSSVIDTATRLINHVIVGANFTAYQELKKLAHTYQPDLKDLPSYQHMIIGLISGAMGPFSNAPIDTIKTRKFILQGLPTSK